MNSIGQNEMRFAGQKRCAEEAKLMPKCEEGSTNGIRAAETVVETVLVASTIH